MLRCFVWHGADCRLCLDPCVTLAARFGVCRGLPCHHFRHCLFGLDLLFRWLIPVHGLPRSVVARFPDVFVFCFWILHCKSWNCLLAAKKAAFQSQKMFLFHPAPHTFRHALVDDCRREVCLLNVPAMLTRDVSLISSSFSRVLCTCRVQLRTCFVEHGSA